MTTNDLIYGEDSLPVLVFTGYTEFLVGGKDRSSQWTKVRDEYIKANPDCECCTRKAETVHHKRPYHLFPDLELDKSNLMSVCDHCHLVLLHAGDFRLWMDMPDLEAARHRNIVKLAKKRSVKL
jgi:hypothetical protein